VAAGLGCFASVFLRRAALALGYEFLMIHHPSAQAPSEVRRAWFLAAVVSDDPQIRMQKMREKPGSFSRLGSGVGPPAGIDEFTFRR
jgi:hypothetical protein